MATQPIGDRFISVEEYLSTSYEPDCEYWDGELLERNVGTSVHQEFQLALAFFFRARRKAWNIHVYTDVRTRIRTGRYLLPDVMVYTGEKPTGFFDGDFFGRLRRDAQAGAFPQTGRDLSDH